MHVPHMQSSGMVLARIRELPPVTVREPSADVIRRWRDAG
jgi:hypothetical protein